MFFKKEPNGIVYTPAIMRAITRMALRAILNSRWSTL